MNVNDALFYQSLYHLVHLPGAGRTLTLSTGDLTRPLLHLTFDHELRLLLHIPVADLRDAEVQRAAQVLAQYMDRTEGLIVFPYGDPQTSSDIAACIVNANEYIAQELIRLIVTQVFNLAEDMELQVHKDYEDRDDLARIAAALSRLMTRPQGTVSVMHTHSGRALHFTHAESVPGFLMELQLDDLDTAERARARDWFVTKGFQLWEHDQGACLQMMEPDDAVLTVLQLRFVPDADLGARYTLDVFMTIFELPLDVRLVLQER